MTNIAAARQLIERVATLGVRDFCVCAGSRNAPLLAVLAGARGARLLSFVDERSASFFALGRIKAGGQPVAVITTSGTAVAELLPAVIEAHYAALPLVLITADRPARFRGTGAPQTIDQQAIFGDYASTEIDQWPGTKPLHLNIEFDEPLVDAVCDEWTLSALKFEPGISRRGARSSPTLRVPRPVVIVGRLAPHERERVRAELLRLGAPVYAEPLSGLREDPALRDLLITAGERILVRGEFECVVRVGGVPTLRFWRDLEETLRALPIFSFSDLPYPGSTRGEVRLLADLTLLQTERVDHSAFFRLDRSLARRIEELLTREPHSEPALFRALSLEIPRRSRLYLGNSLPIREWDLFAAREPRELSCEGNRGANGIDGQVSTFLGWCLPSAINVCVVGDLTALYDLNAPWICRQLDPRVGLRVIVVNNGGGRIFSRVSSLASIEEKFRRRVIENEHDLRFDDWAAMWRMDYEWSALVTPFPHDSASRNVTELAPDAEATRRFWTAYDDLWR